MRLRFKRSCILWLLPILAARALVPAGFMPAVAHGSLALRFCADGVAAVQVSRAADGADAAAVASVAGPASEPALYALRAAQADHATRHAGSSHTGSECPFAQSTGPLLGSARSPPPPAPPPAAIDAWTALVSVPAQAPLRHAAPRGPPLVTSGMA